LREAYIVATMRIAVATDMREGVADALIERLEAAGHELLKFGAFDPEGRADWAWGSEAAARAVADGRAEQGVVCCWTGTGASIAANKVPGVRAALCADPETAEGAREWNDANVLALSLRLVSGPLLGEILEAWFGASASADPDDAANVAHVDQIS
jgi:ribose 5-phosphate isomerase B